MLNCEFGMRNGATADYCHPERSEGSIAKMEMLRSAQHDTRIPDSAFHIRTESETWSIE